MDRQAKIAQLELNSFTFEVDLTLDELDWTRLLGPDGFGVELLDEITSLGAPYFDMGGPEHAHNGNGEVLSFTVDGQRHELRLDYDQPFLATLLGGVRDVLDSVNRALRRAALPLRYVCLRESCTGAGCTYRVVLIPPAWLDDLRKEYTLVTGLCPEDYETTLPARLFDTDEDLSELR
ncbi:MAG: hypothetical protein ACOCV2_11340 [Persicimonas sp.]